MASEIFYLGGYAEPGEAGIRMCSLEPRTGECLVRAECSALVNPSYLLCHPRRKILYAVEEMVPEGRIAALSAEGDRLEKICALPSGGADPCHLALSPDARHLFVANYSGGSLAVFALDEAGVPVKRTDFVRHRLDMRAREGANPLRQESAHVHFSLCDGARVFVCDLGLDAVFVYGWDAGCGKLIDNGERIELPRGVGPRHLVISDDRRFLYVMCELSAQVAVFACGEGGDWRQIQAVSSVPEDFRSFADFRYSTGAAIRFADRETLCVSNRGHDSVACFRVCADGRLSERRILPSEGRTPRDIQVIGGQLIAANQDSGSVAVFGREAGGYVPLASAIVGGKPSCVCAVPWK